MSFKGKVVKRINTPLGVLTETEYDGFPRRSKVIWWMGAGKVVELGKLIIVYTVESGREDDFEPIKWEPLCFKVKLTEDADTEEAIERYFMPEEVTLGDAFEFDEKEKAEGFVELLKCEGITVGGIEIGSRAEFKRWKEAVEKVYKNE